jgi:hypothetical protein
MAGVALSTGGVRRRCAAQWRGRGRLRVSPARRRRCSDIEEDGERLSLGGALASAIAARKLGTPWLKRAATGGGRQAPEGGGSGGRLQNTERRCVGLGAMRRGRREGASIAHRGNNGTGA